MYVKLGEMLRHYADSEAHKRQQFEVQSARWTQKITELYGEIEQWLAPVKRDGLLEVQREAYVASGPSVPVETSTFKTEKLTIHIAGKPGGVCAGCDGGGWVDFVVGHGAGLLLATAVFRWCCCRGMMIGCGRKPMA